MTNATTSACAGLGGVASVAVGGQFWHFQGGDPVGKAISKEKSEIERKMMMGQLTKGSTILLA